MEYTGEPLTLIGGPRSGETSADRGESISIFGCDGRYDKYIKLKISGGMRSFHAYVYENDTARHPIELLLSELRRSNHQTKPIKEIL